MGDAFQTSVGEAILQGAQVFNQAVAIYLQDRRAQANFDARQKEADALNKMREQKFKMEQEVFDLEKQKTALEMERLRAETERIEAVTAAIPTKTEAEMMRARSGAKRVDISEIKMRANTSRQAYLAQLKGGEAEYDKAINATAGMDLGQEDLREFSGVDMHTLQELYKEAQERTMRLQATPDALFPDQNKEQVRVLQERTSKIRRAYSIRRDQVLNKLAEYEKEGAAKGLQTQVQWLLQRGEAGAGISTPTSRLDDEAAARANNNQPVKSPTDIRLENLINFITAKPDLTPGAFQTTDLAHTAKELVALGAIDEYKKRMSELLIHLKQKLPADDYNALLREVDAEMKVSEVRR